LISILRNPIDRAYSEYQDWSSRESNPPSFETVIENEINLQREYPRLITEGNLIIPKRTDFYFIN